MNIQQRRDFVLKNLLVDSCRIYPNESYTLSAEGLPIFSTPAAVLYNGSPDIPCRLDTQRTLFNDKFKEQALVATGYSLDLPYDLNVKESYIVVVNSQKYVIRRLYKEGALAVVLEALVVVLGE